MNRADLLLYALTVCVRALTFDQTMRLLAVRDEANFRRFLRPLVAAGLVNVVRVLAKPVPEMREPLFAWRPQMLGEEGAEPYIGRILYRAAARWADVSAVPHTCVVSTKKAGQLYGVKRSGSLAKPLQATHDLAVSQCYVWKATHQPIEAEHWRGEDVADFRLGAKTPDAVIISPGNIEGPGKVLEIVGAEYTQDDLLSIHRQCQNQGIAAYELW